MESERPIILKRRVGVANLIDSRDQWTKAVGTIEIPMPDLVFLGIEIFFAAVTDGAIFQQLKGWPIDAVVRAQRCCQNQANCKCGRAAHLQELSQNVGRVRPLVWAKELAHWSLSQLSQI